MHRVRGKHHSSDGVGPDLLERNNDRCLDSLGATQTIDRASNGVDDATRKPNDYGVANLGLAARVAINGRARTVNQRRKRVNV